MKLPNLRAAYTLIEILVGLTIIALVFIVGYVSYREFARRQVLATSVRQVIADMRLAQAQSFAGKKPDTLVCNDPNYLQGYNFFIINTTTYRIEALCSGGVYEIKTVVLTPPVTIAASSTNPILFKVLGQGTNLVSDTPVTVTANGLNQNITIGKGGSVE